VAGSRGGGTVSGAVAGLGGGAGDSDAAGLDHGGRDNDLAVAGGDAELGGVLVLAGDIVDDLDAVSVGAVGGLEGGGRSPGEGTAVGDTLSDGRTELDNVGGGALEEEDRDGVGGSWLPSDGELLAGGDNLVGRISFKGLVWFRDAREGAKLRGADIPRSKDG
jgi:hypothetical protein